MNERDKGESELNSTYIIFINTKQKHWGQVQQRIIIVFGFGWKLEHTLGDIAHRAQDKALALPLAVWRVTWRWRLSVCHLCSSVLWLCVFSFCCVRMRSPFCACANWNQLHDNSFRTEAVPDVLGAATLSGRSKFWVCNCNCYLFCELLYDLSFWSRVPEPHETSSDHWSL